MSRKVNHSLGKTYREYLIRTISCWVHLANIQFLIRIWMFNHASLFFFLFLKKKKINLFPSLSLQHWQNKSTCCPYMNCYFHGALGSCLMKKKRPPPTGTVFPSPHAAVVLKWLLSGCWWAQTDRGKDKHSTSSHINTNVKQVEKKPAVMGTKLDFRHCLTPVVHFLHGRTFPHNNEAV